VCILCFSVYVYGQRPNSSTDSIIIKTVERWIQRNHIKNGFSTNTFIIQLKIGQEVKINLLKPSISIDYDKMKLLELDLSSNLKQRNRGTVLISVNISVLDDKDNISNLAISEKVHLEKIIMRTSFDKLLYVNYVVIDEKKQ